MAEGIKRNAMNETNFANWLREMVDKEKPEVAAEYGLSVDPIQLPDGLPTEPAEKIAVSYGNEFFITPIALILRTDSHLIRLLWAEIASLEHDQTKDGYAWQFKTIAGPRYTYVWGNGAPLGAFSDIVTECLAEMGAQQIERRSQWGRPYLWDVAPEHRTRERWIRDYAETKAPELIPILRSAWGYFDHEQKTNVLTDKAIQFFAESSRDSRIRIVEEISAILGVLGVRHAVIRDLIVQLSNDKNAKIRHTAILSVTPEIPGKFALSILRAGLNDKNAENRAKAANQALRHRIRELVPDISSRLEQEKNARVREGFEFCVPLLRDGYSLKQLGDGRYNLRVVTRRGGVSSRHVTESELKARGIEAIMEELSRSPGS